MNKTERETVMRLRGDGMGYKEIADKTGLSINTIKSFCRRNLAQSSPADKENTCLQCGAALTHIPHRKKKKFCSDSCRMAWWNAHQELVNRKAVYHLTCQNCGKGFESYGNTKRKYCSRSCYGESRAKAVGK